MTSLVFIQNFGDYSFICNYWTVYCLRIIYHLFASFVAVPLKYEKIMASKPFTFYLRMHIFLTVIQIFTEKYFSSNFWIADPLNMVYLYLFSFLRDLHTDNRWMANKYTKHIKCSRNRWKTADVSKNITWCLKAIT